MSSAGSLGILNRPDVNDRIYNLDINNLTKLIPAPVTLDTQKIGQILSDFIDLAYFIESS